MKLPLFFRLAFALSIVLAAALLLIPADAVTSLRTEIAWFGWSFRSVGALSPAVDMHHGVMFAELGPLAHLAFPQASVPKVLLSLAAFAMATELAQFFVPGREPQGSDVLMDLLGALLGYGLGALFGWPLKAAVQKRTKRVTLLA